MFTLARFPFISLPPFFFWFISDFRFDPLSHFPRPRSFHGNFIFPWGYRYSVARDHKREPAQRLLTYLMKTWLRVSSYERRALQFFRYFFAGRALRKIFAAGVHEKFDSTLAVRYRANLYGVVSASFVCLNKVSTVPPVKQNMKPGGYDLY